MSLGIFVHPEYISLTKWELHGLKMPIDFQSYTLQQEKINGLCKCVFSSGFLFHWCRKKTINFLTPTSIATNNAEYEATMWLLNDLLKILRDLRDATLKQSKLLNESDIPGSNSLNSIRGFYLQEAYRTICKINKMKWPAGTDDSTKAKLLLEILNSGPMPWYILPVCNLSLRLWIHSELILCKLNHLKQQGNSIDSLTYCQYIFHAAHLLIRAVDSAQNCPADYIAALQIDLQIRKVKAYVWLAKQHPRYAEAPSLRLKLLQHANSILTTLENTPNAVPLSFGNPVRKHLSEEIRIFKFVGYQDGDCTIDFDNCINPANFTDLPKTGCDIDDVLAVSFLSSTE